MGAAVTLDGYIAESRHSAIGLQVAWPLTRRGGAGLAEPRLTPSLGRSETARPNTSASRVQSGTSSIMLRMSSAVSVSARSG